MKNLYTVKEVSELLDLTEHTIRYYTDKGLVPSIIRDKNNIRLFNEESINWLKGIKYLKGTGMSIESMKEYVDLCLKGESTIQERYQIILDQKEIAERQLKEAIERVEYLRNKAVHYLEIVNHKIADDTNPGKWSSNL